MSRPQHHVFICQNERDPENPRGSCYHKDSKAVLKCFKETIISQGLRERIEFDGSTCMDCCAVGPAVVVYPENVWYGGVTVEDVPEIVEAIAKGTVVERLLIPDEQVRKS